MALLPSSGSSVLTALHLIQSDGHGSQAAGLSFDLGAPGPGSAWERVIVAMNASRDFGSRTPKAPAYVEIEASKPAKDPATLLVVVFRL